MDLFTIPTAYDPEPLPWSTMLAVHEGRHVTQMQFGMTRVQKPFGYVFGEMWNILGSLVYPGMAFIEGDAVVAETALTDSGRGRTADFLNYYRFAFDNGDFRKFDRWQFGSQMKYTPNHYALGYMYLAGSRYIYDYPSIMKDGYNMANHKIFNLSPFYTLIKEKSGKKRENSFREVCDTMHGIWKRDDAKRAPFIPMETVTSQTRRYTDYGNIISTDKGLYAIKKGFVNNPSLVRIDHDGNEKFISNLSYNTSYLKYDDGKLIWSEEIPDCRWSMKADSRIRQMSIEGGRKKNMTDRKSLLYNPSVKNGKTAAAQYFQQGHTGINIDGQTFTAPEGLQIVETEWIGNDVYSSAISDGGFGIYGFSTNDHTWRTVLAPAPVKIVNLSSVENILTFTCDRTGVNEFYHLDPETGKLTQKTSLKYGGSDFCYSDNGEYLYFSSQTSKGMMIFRTQTDSLLNKEVEFSDVHKYVIADKLSEQELTLSLENGENKAVDEDIKVEFSEPKKYSKVGHMFNIHSWTPIYVSVDNIMNTSFDYIYQAASLGVSTIMQNRLATGVGEAGYSAHKDPYDPSKWRHSGHFKYTYSGLFPVFELKVDINDRAARQFNVSQVSDGNSIMQISGTSRSLDCPFVEGRLRTYIPFNFSSGGWHRGVIPQLSYKISNDRMNSTIANFDGSVGTVGKNSLPYAFIGITEGRNTIKQTLSGSIRAYTSQPIPNSAVYPRWGLGVEIGAMGDCVNNDIFAPMGYVYGYGYVPGIIRTQGLKLTAWYQRKLSNESIFGQPYVNILPRGLSDNGYLHQWVANMYTHATKFTADYAIPVYIGDVSIAKGLVYIKRLTLTPHVDYTRVGEFNLMSAGTSLTFDLNGIIWIGWPVSIGASWSYNNMCDFKVLQKITGFEMKKHDFGFIFNVSF